MYFDDKSLYDDARCVSNVYKALTRLTKESDAASEQMRMSAVRRFVCLLKRAPQRAYAALHSQSGCL